jgi:hypothetical protein
MKVTKTLSLALNALLVGFVTWLACAGPHWEIRADISRFLANRGLRVKPHFALPPPACGLAPEVVEIEESFHWAQLESADYRVYLANLRGLGCPESTVRDILIADVNDLFIGRVKALVDEVSGRFWNLITHEAELRELVEAKAKQLSALKEQRDELLTTLFGAANPRADEEQLAAAAAVREQWERVADFLPAEKRARFAAGKEELERAWTEVLRTPDLTNAQRQARRKELDAAQDLSLRAWLSSGEYDELRLRQSPAAGLPHRLVGLDLSEATVDAVAKIQFARDQALAVLSSKDADFNSRTGQLQQQSEAQTRELLGLDGYAAFQRATDQRYEPIYRVTQRLELSDATAASAYDIRRQAEDAAGRLRNDPSLAPDARLGGLQAIGAEAKQSLAAALGTKGFAAYERIDGGWLQQLAAAKR